MEFISFYILAWICGIIFGFVIGAGYLKLRWRSYKKHVGILQEIDERTIKALETIIESKDNTINLWCKRINRKKGIVNHGKRQLKDNLKVITEMMVEYHKSIDEVFKE